MSQQKWWSLFPSPPSLSLAFLCPFLPPFGTFHELDFRKDFTDLEEMGEMNSSNLFIFEDEEMEVQTREGRCTRSHHQFAAGLRWEPTSSSFSSTSLSTGFALWGLSSQHWATSALGLSFLECLEIVLFHIENWESRAVNTSLPTFPAYWLWAQQQSSAAIKQHRQLHPPLPVPRTMQLCAPSEHKDLSFLSMTLCMGSSDCWPLPGDYKLSESRSPFSVFVFSAFYALLNRCQVHHRCSISICWMNE